MENIQNTTASSFSQRSLDLILANKGRIHAYCNRFLLVSLFVSSLAYIGTVNDLSIKGFVLQEMRSKVVELENENERSELMVMEMESFERINERARRLGMVKVDELRYASRVDGNVALR